MFCYVNMQFWGIVSMKKETIVDFSSAKVDKKMRLANYSLIFSRLALSFFLSDVLALLDLPLFPADVFPFAGERLLP